MFPQPNKTRYYAHGDLHADRPETYYCARCDLFVPVQHFADPDHVRDRARYYERSLRILARHNAKKRTPFFRPQEAENVVAEAAIADAKTSKSARSTYFRWLSRQAERDDPIGDLARDARSDAGFPQATTDIEVLRAYLIRRHASSKACVALAESWGEFKAKGKKRAGISVTVRFIVFKRDSYRCCLCGATALDGRRLEIDHKVPVAKGGSNEPDNLWTLCAECNRGKSAHDL